MTLTEVWDANKYLRYNPPLHEIIGDYFGARKKYEGDTPKRATREEMKAMVNALNRRN